MSTEDKKTPKHVSYIVGNISLVIDGLHNKPVIKAFCRSVNNYILKNPIKNAEHKPNSV